MRVRLLAAFALLLQQAQAGVHDVAVGDELPAVLQVHLLAAGLVEEPVVVLVVVVEALLAVQQQDGAQLLAEVDVAVGVGFQSAV